MKKVHFLGLIGLLIAAGLSPLFAQAPSFDRSNTYGREYVLGLPHWSPVIFSLQSPGYDSAAYEAIEFTAEGLPSGLSLKKSASSAEVSVVGEPTETGEFEVSIKAVNQYGSSTLRELVMKVFPRVPDLPDPDYWGSYGDESLNPRQSEELDALELLGPWGYYFDALEWRVEGLPGDLEYYTLSGHIGALYFDGKLYDSGEFPISVTVSNEYGSNTRDYILNVRSNKPGIGFIQGDVIEVDVGESVNITLENYVHQGEGAGAKWEAVGLPAGLTLDGHDYALFIEGNVVERGHYEIEIIAINDFGRSTAQIDLYVGVSSNSPDSVFVEGYTRFAETFAYSDWLGFVFDANFPWIYNFEQGWLYVWEGTTSQDEVWFYHPGPPAKGWMFSGRNLNGFFYYEVTPGVWTWQWLYTGTFDPNAPGDGPPENP